jgi:hypothetical protein
MQVPCHPLCRLCDTVPITSLQCTKALFFRGGLSSSPDTMECIGAIDQGTQSSRFYLYSKDCSTIASSQVNPKRDTLMRCHIVLLAYQ